ncbi:DUF4114 domain-containing protein [Parasediminibacterium sp. JCM 36343]|uniref:DUF4114 domain-containing protein n=1 Tax=Parasediminibacterium sp. JCM 36343 TaxID=3374279 RepID=UPI003979860C
MYKNSTRSFLFVLFTLANIFVNAQFSYMGAYNWAGKPTYLVTPSDTFSAGFRDKIAVNLPEYRPLPVYNPRLLASGRPEAINLSAAADVWVTFVDEGASYRNALGYYTYNTNAPLAKAPADSSIKMIFPNASKSGFGGDLNPGDKVYLGKFPANTSIAFVLVVDGWNGSTVINSKGILYANAAFNPETADSLKKHTIMFNDAASGRLVMGFEDVRRDNAQCDNDFNDLLFYATINARASVANNDSIPNMIDNGQYVYSGNTGGLESKSLGDIIGKRMLNKYKKGGNTPIDYSVTQKYGNTNYATFGTTSPASISNLQMLDIMPAKVYDAGYTAYLTSPTDITGFTNAMEVSSIDFTQGTTCKAVAFATKTKGSVYAHTKPVCDRLRGSQILSIENFTLQNLTFVRYALKRPAGNIEYSTSFSIGTKAGRDTFSFQSNWLTKDYVNDEVMYNYQLWAASPYLVTDLMLEVLKKLKAIAPIKAYDVQAKLPNTYVAAAKRELGVLQFNVKNASASTTGYFEMDERKNEQSGIITKRFPFTIAANDTSTVNIAVNDAYEHDIRMVINGNVQDLLYMSDGNWAIDYNEAKTSIKQFTVSNDSASNYTTDYPVYRDIHIAGSTSDYVSVYKLLKGGGATADLTGFEKIKFTANGGNNLRITLLKNSIANWSDQYTIVLPLASEKKDYSVSLSDFKSALSESGMDLTDVTTVVFSIEIPTRNVTDVNSSLSNIGFAKAGVEVVAKDTVINTEVSKNVQVYPNPSRGNFKFAFQSNSETAFAIRISELSSGRLVYTTKYQAVKGLNTIAVDIANKIATNGVYILCVVKEDEKYTNSRVMISK